MFRKPHQPLEASALRHAQKAIRRTGTEIRGASFARFERPVTWLAAMLLASVLVVGLVWVVVFADTPAQRWRQGFVSLLALSLTGGFVAWVARVESQRELVGPTTVARSLGVFASLCGVFAFGLGAWGMTSAARVAISGVNIQRTWQAPSVPYVAKVVGFVDRGGVRIRAHAPEIEITFSDGRTNRFISSRAEAVRSFAVGEAVAVLMQPSSLYHPVFEIDSAIHLWVKDALLALVALGFLAAVPVILIRGGVVRLPW